MIDPPYVKAPKHMSEFGPRGPRGPSNVSDRRVLVYYLVAFSHLLLNHMRKECLSNLPSNYLTLPYLTGYGILRPLGL